MSTPETNQPSRRNGFDVMLGNPPWERVKLQDQEFFAQRDPAVAGASNASARKRAIAALKETNPTLLREFAEATRQADGESHLMRSSGRYPLCGRGDINTYAIFAESMRDAVSPTGRLGVIVPTGIATDDTTKFFFGDMVETRTLVSYFGFKNERFLFPRPVEHTVTFGLLTVLGRAQSSPKMEFCWLAWTVEEMNDPTRRIVLTTDDIERLNPNTRTCPVFRSERDAEITKAIYRSVPVLIREAGGGKAESNPWGLTFLRMFDMANASGLFIDPEKACPVVREFLSDTPEATPPYLPLYEAKMLHQFNHRWATYALSGCDWLTTPILTKINKEGKLGPDTRAVTVAEQANPAALAAPRYWVRSDAVEARLIKTDKDGRVLWRWERRWILGWRDIARNTDERTLIATVFPRTAVGDKFLLMFPDVEDARTAAGLIACLNSFAVDFAARQKVGGTAVKYFTFKQLPVLPPLVFADACPWDTSTTLAEWIAPRVLELVYTAHDLAGFARDLDYDGPPFRWDPARRSQIRAEFDAAFFHLYGMSHDDAAYILDTFLVFKAREEERNGGVYKTKQTILAIYDEMAEAMTAAPNGSPVITPTILPPTRAQIDRGRAAAYLTLLAATWDKPVGRQAMEYALVLMLNDTVRAKILAQARSGTGTTVAPTQTRPTPPSQAQARTFVQGLDAMIGLLDSNQVLKLTTQAGMQRIEMGLAGFGATQNLPQADWAKAKEAVAAFEVLRTNLQRLDSLADAKDLEFSVA